VREERAERHRPVHRDRHVERAVHPEKREQQGGRDEAGRTGPERVRVREDAHGAADVRRAPHEVCDQHRQRRAHEQRRDDHEREARGGGDGERRAEHERGDLVEDAQRRETERTGRELDPGEQRKERHVFAPGEPAAGEAPSPSPSMNAVTTIVTDSTLTPKIRNSARCQTSW
jgi:hypothetical protein